MIKTITDICVAFLIGFYIGHSTNTVIVNPVVTPEITISLTDEQIDHAIDRVGTKIKNNHGDPFWGCVFETKPCTIRPIGK